MAQNKAQDVMQDKIHDKAHEKVVEKRRALGRGLESLLPRPQRITPAVAESTPAPITMPAETSSSAMESLSPSESPVTSISPQATVAELRASEGGEQVVQLRLELIERNPHQTRAFFKEELLNELAKSIKTQGLLQPIVVRPGPEGRYRLILGERRMRAANIAGLETIPAVVKRVSEQQAAEMTLVENLQRQDLNPVDMAKAFSNLSQEFALTQEEIGARVGVSRETVANYIRLLTLPSGVLEALIGGRLTLSHAKALMPLKEDTQIWSFAKRAMEENLSVSDLESLVKGMHVPHKVPLGPPRGARWVDPNVKAAQRNLESILGMRVRIRDKAGRGRITIEYATIEDFDRVMEMLGGRR
ncbi:MAG TPA: ParB/RepB/Spo0J family partition protein [Terriglobales bacterium]|nr:ParB/RepB/Spo0J family partition protein [Terriglobales bacterium]